MAVAEAVAAAPLANINPPPQLCLKDSPKEEWTMFKRLFNNYAVITRLNRQEKPYQLAVLLNVMGPTGVRLYDNLTFTEQEDKEDTTLIIRKIYAAIQGEINETYERYVFNRRNEGTEESFDSYLAEIRNLAKSCNFCDCMSDSLIRDRIVMGVYDAGT